MKLVKRLKYWNLPIYLQNASEHMNCTLTISARETNLYEAKMEGFTEGEARGKALEETLGEAKGIIKGNNQTLSIIKDLKDPSNTTESISEKYGVSVEFIREIQSLLG